MESTFHLFYYYYYFSTIHWEVISALTRAYLCGKESDSTCVCVEHVLQKWSNRRYPGWSVTPDDDNLAVDCLLILLIYSTK